MRRRRPIPLEGRRTYCTILLRARAVAGITPVGEATDQNQPEEDSTKLRVCPYDIVFKHQCRIERCLKGGPS